MKKQIAMVLSLLMLSLLAACGGETNQETEPVGLKEFYSKLEETYQWEEGYMEDIEGDLLEDYYSGIGDISTKQFLAKTPMMGAAVNEVVLAECETKTDADQLAEILQKRIDYQVGDGEGPGGAWYPEMTESWKKAEVVQHGTYVALVASDDGQKEIVQAFHELFE